MYTLTNLNAIIYLVIKMKMVWEMISNILCLIISILMYILLVILLVVFSIKNILGYNTINKLLQNTNINEFIKEVDSSDTFMSTLYSIGKKVELTHDEVNSLLESKSVKKLVAKYIAGSTH